MYKMMTRRIVRGAFKRMSEGDYETPMKLFHRDIHFFYAGDNALGCDVHGIDGVRQWFERAFRLFPGVRFDPQTIVVNGGPWNATIATYFTVSAELPGDRPYRNQGMQLLRLKWGKAVEDLVFEDTQIISEGLEHLAEHGMDEAAAPPVALAS